jgi:hypothetical protein
MSGLRFLTSALLALSGCSERDVPAVMTRSPSGRALHWSKKEIVLTPAPESAGAQPPAVLRNALEAAVRRWNRALGDCGAPRLLANLETLSAPLVRDDVVNAVLLHERRWCPPGVVEPEDCYPGDVTGRTHLYPRLSRGSSGDGELAGADIELNGVQGAPATRSLEASLMHELGHVLGLDHPCGPNGDFRRSNGEQLSSCDDERAKRQLMHPSWAARVTGDDLAPTATEVAAVCAVYAPAP